jgi:integrase
MQPTSRKPSGSVKRFGEIWRARVRYFDPVFRKHRELVAKRRTEADTNDALDELLTQAERLQSGPVKDKSTFARFAVYYIEHHCIERRYAEQPGGAKLLVSGKKSWSKEKRIIEQDLLPYFGKWRLDEFTYTKIHDWRVARFKSPINYVRCKCADRGRTCQHDQTERYRSLASVHRPLEILRHMFTVAIEDGWMDGPSPFKSEKRGLKSLIQKSQETKRKRFPSVAEEVRLLDALEADERRHHWIPRTIAAIDTGMRRGEIDVCEWWQVDFDRNAVLIVAPKVEHHGRKEESEHGEDRIVVMTERVRKLFIELRELAIAKGTTGEDDRVFPQIHQTTNRAWHTACRVAGIKNLRFNDLRHTIGSRLSASGIMPQQIGKLLGHRQISTTWIYMNLDLSMQAEATRRLEQYRAEQLEQLVTTAA